MDNEIKNEIDRFKTERRNRITSMSNKSIKSAITRTCKSLKQWENTMKQFGCDLYPTYGHTEAEVLLEFAPSLNDPKYESMLIEVLQVVKRYQLKSFVSILIKNKAGQYEN